METVFSSNIWLSINSISPFTIFLSCRLTSAVLFLKIEIYRSGDFNVAAFLEVVQTQQHSWNIDLVHPVNITFNVIFSTQQHSRNMALVHAVTIAFDVVFHTVAFLEHGRCACSDYSFNAIFHTVAVLGTSTLCMQWPLI